MNWQSTWRSRKEFYSTVDRFRRPGLFSTRSTRRLRIFLNAVNTMSLQSLMNQDFGDADSDSSDEDFDPALHGDSGDEDDLPASIEAQACF